MVSSRRVKLTSVFSWFLLILVIALTLLGSTRLASHAAGKSLKSPTQSKVTASCKVWSDASSPNVGSDSDFLYGVAAVSVSDIWAVGLDVSTSSGTNVGQTLTEHWNGTSWSVVFSPNPGLGDQLFGVAAVSTSDVWAVGYYNSANGNHQTLIEHWNGTSWSVVFSPNPGPGDNHLNGVVALSASNIWAVGYDTDGFSNYQTLIEHWDGTSWSVVSSPNVVGSSINILSGVTAVSKSNVWAVGYDSNTTGSTYIAKVLTEHWDGTGWSVVSSPNIGPSTNVLSGVVLVPNSSKLWAVGYYNTSGGTAQTLIEHWNGTGWRITFSQDVGSNDYLTGVTAVSARNAWAVGYSDNGTLIEHWNGTSWSVVSSPNVGTANNSLAAVTHAPGTSQTWAVGFYNGDTGSQTLIEFYC